MQIGSSSVPSYNSWAGVSRIFQGSDSYAGTTETSFRSLSDFSAAVAPVISQTRQTDISKDVKPGEDPSVMEEANGNPSRVNGKSQEENDQSVEKEFSEGSRDFDELSQAEKQLVKELEQMDTKVRTHEMAHLSAAGSLAISGPTYDYQKGPDGKKYAVGGEVQIDTAPIPGDPEATLQKMQQVKKAALAPAEPSGQDRRVAAKAAATAAKARAEMFQLKMEEQAGTSKSFSLRGLKDAVNSYLEAGSLSEENSGTFSLAV